MVAQFEQIVQLVLAGDPAGEDMLYTTFSRGMSYLAARQCRSEDVQDVVHDAIMEALINIRKGYVETPSALPGYIKTVLMRCIWKVRQKFNREQQGGLLPNKGVAFGSVASNQELDLLEVERMERVGEAMASLSEIDREILTRTYLREETMESVMLAMRLTPTQFRLRKSRAKQRVVDAFQLASRRGTYKALQRKLVA